MTTNYGRQKAAPSHVSRGNTVDHPVKPKAAPASSVGKATKKPD